MKEGKRIGEFTKDPGGGGWRHNQEPGIGWKVISDPGGGGGSPLSYDPGTGK